MNYSYWLANIPGIRNRMMLEVLAQVGSAEELYFMNEEQLKKLDCLDEKARRGILESHNVDFNASYTKMCGKGITFLSLENEEYPKRLKCIPDAPYGIYVKGRLPREEQKTVAIVGARMCSPYGHAMAKEIGRRLSEAGVCVISGLARGIDSDGHLGALEVGGMTCAVLGNGVDICYPAANASLYERILDQGCIISEYAPGTEARPMFFPARNRIISGLSDVVVVVEAKQKSGSLITADFALEQGRDIYAVPGRVDEPLSAGCNALIRQGAGIISDVGEFLKELELCPAGEARQENFHKLLLEKEESLVYIELSLRPKSMEELLTATGLSVPELSGILTRLIQKGFITETFKNNYIRRI